MAAFSAAVAWPATPRPRRAGPGSAARRWACCSCASRRSICAGALAQRARAGCTSSSPNDEQAEHRGGHGAERRGVRGTGCATRPARCRAALRQRRAAGLQRARSRAGPRSVRDSTSCAPLVSMPAGRLQLAAELRHLLLAPAGGEREATVSKRSVARPAGGRPARPTRRLQHLEVGCPPCHQRAQRLHLALHHGAGIALCSRDRWRAGRARAPLPCIGLLA